MTQSVGCLFKHEMETAIELFFLNSNNSKKKKKRKGKKNTSR